MLRHGHKGHTWEKGHIMWNGIHLTDALIVVGTLGAGWLLLHVGYRDGYKEAHREQELARRWRNQ